MVWKISISEVAARQLKKMDKVAAKNILTYLKERVADKNDPRIFGKPLLHDKSGYWRYHVGDYRIICQIEDHELTVVVLRLGHGKNIYY